MNYKLPYGFFRKLAPGLTTISLIAMYSTSANAQSTLPPYSDVAKQRLLIRITAHYLYTNSQGQIDMDSAIRIPCRIYGLSPLLAYNEGYSDGKPSTGIRLIEVGKVKEAKALLPRLRDEDRVRLLVELGSYFVFKPGTDKADLDEASKYIHEAIELSKTQSTQWRIESQMLQAFYLHQSGLTDQSQWAFAQTSNLCEQTGDELASARTLLDATRLLHYGHPLRLPNFEKALTIFQAHQSKEKEIETMSEINVEHFIAGRYDSVKQLTLKIVERQTEINFRHHQYAYDVLGFLAHQTGDFASAISYSQKSLEGLTSRADSVFLTLFLTRRGMLYAGMSKLDEALALFSKALEKKSNETRLYWYRAFLCKAIILNGSNKPAEALTLLQETGNQFPAISIYEKMYFAVGIGVAYEKLKKFDQAEVNYNIFLALAENFPTEHIHNEFPDAYSSISDFYRSIGKTGKARELLDLVKPMWFRSGAAGKAAYYHYLFSIDSTEKKYLQAIKDLQLSHKFFDSAYSYDQRKKADELLVKYEAEKKDKDIQLLRQQGELQKTRLQQSQLGQRVTFGSAGLFFLIAGLLYYFYRTKQKSNTQLQHLLTEKEWLLKEVHHRVKNNLQTVLSLLESQSRQLSNEALHAIQESQNRVYAMSLIHKKLYQSTDVASINMEGYLRDLIQHIRESFGQSGSIRFFLQLEPINLDVSQAVPLGLIVNEAITNSIKYAFSEKGLGNEICVSLTDTNEKVELIISDNGSGMAEIQGATQGLGLKLMRGLTGDIEGVFTISSENGVTIKVLFEPNVPLQRINHRFIKASI